MSSTTADPDRQLDAIVLREDAKQAFRRLDLAFQLAWTETKARYRRSVLGPLWLVLGTTIGVGGLGFVWGALLAAQLEDFIPSLTIGLVAWYLLSSSTVDAAGVFYRNRDLLLNLRISSLLLSVQLLMRHLVNFTHNLIVVLVVLSIFPQHWSWDTLLFFPGVLLVCANLLWLIQLLGYVGARFRDVEPMLVAIMAPLFFITPVIFRPAQLQEHRLILELNPFAYWLSLIRDPLMGTPPGGMTWLVSILMTVCGWTAALLMTARKRRQLAYWVS